MVDTSDVPEWLLALLTEKFFNACIIHENERKNEKNVFCFDCSKGFCPHCLSDHTSHRLLQIRRYMYQDVIRLSDADKLMNCTQVQSYTTNSAKVVFLNQRPQTSRPPRVSGNLCITCDRNLQESFLYCSISCKLQHIIGTGCNISMYLRNCEFLSLPEPVSDDGHMTPDSVLEQNGSMRTDSCSSGGGGGTAELVDCLNLSCTATTEIVKKKRSSLPSCHSGLRRACRPVSEVSESMMNRRKGKPHRSPLH